VSGIQLGGLASGLDTQGLISQLMAVERGPRSRITLQQAAAQARETALQSVRTDLNALKLATSGMRSAAVWADTQSVESSDATKLTVRRTGGAGPGGYDVAVTQMAAAERRTYAYAAPAAASQIEIFGTDKTKARAVIDLAVGATVDDAAAAINANDKAGVFAVNVNGQLVLAARTTGTGSTFTATGAGSQAGVVAGQNAQGTVGSATFDSQTNVVSGAIPGVELTIKGKTSGVTVTVGGPGPDRSALKDAVKAFVSKYNDVAKSMRTEVAEKRVPNATSSVDASKGALFGDSGVSGIISALRTATMDKVSGHSGVDSLAAIGISTGSATSTVDTNAVAGVLKFDEAAFDAALDKDPRAVQKLLGGDSAVPGFAQKLEGLIDPYTNAGGVLDGRISAADGELTRIKDSLARFDDRLTSKQAVLQKQFTALETALAQSQSAGSQLAARLGLGQ
jgi:flagellar hook-associated protein 2